MTPVDEPQDTMPREETGVPHGGEHSAAGRAGMTASGEAPPRVPYDPGMAIDPAELARALSGLVPSADPAPDVISSLRGPSRRRATSSA